MEEINLNNYPKIGEGRHGVVYRLDKKRCLKKYRKEKYAWQEYKVLNHSQKFPQFPRIYQFNGKFMIREYCDGPDIREYILKNGLNRNLAQKLVEIIEVFEQLGYSRLDCQLTHIIVTPGMQLKVIDPTRNMDKKMDYPRQMLHHLDRLGYKDKFLRYVKKYRPDYYNRWTARDWRTG